MLSHMTGPCGAGGSSRFCLIPKCTYDPEVISYIRKGSSDGKSNLLKSNGGIVLLNFSIKPLKSFRTSVAFFCRAWASNWLVRLGLLSSISHVNGSSSEVSSNQKKGCGCLWQRASRRWFWSLVISLETNLLCSWSLFSEELKIPNKFTHTRFGTRSSVGGLRTGVLGSITMHCFSVTNQHEMKKPGTTPCIY